MAGVLLGGEVAASSCAVAGIVAVAARDIVVVAAGGGDVAPVVDLVVVVVHQCGPSHSSRRPCRFHRFLRCLVGGGAPPGFETWDNTCSLHPAVDYHS